MLGGGIWLIGDWDRRQELAGWAGRLTFALLVWLVGWPVWETPAHLGSRLARS